jgi:hypothetical protein
MPIDLHWDNDARTIARFDVRGIWTWQELDAAMAQLYAMQTSENCTADCIVDMTAGNKLPHNPLSNGWRKSRRPQLAGRIVFIGGTAFLKSLMDVFRRLYPIVDQRIFFVDSLEAAHARLALPVED